MFLLPHGVWKTTIGKQQGGAAEDGFFRYMQVPGWVPGNQALREAMIGEGLPNSRRFSREDWSRMVLQVFCKMKAGDIFKKFIYHLGYEAFFLKRISAYGYEYIVPPGNNFAPWLTDDGFKAAYDLIKDHTLVDKYRCYELWFLASQCAKVDGAVLEVGVWKGGTAGLMAKKLALMDSGKKIYLADTFAGVVKAGERDCYYKGGEHKDTSENIARGLLGNILGLDNFEFLVGVFPDDTARLIEESKFSFCHVDVDVYKSAKDVSEWIWPRLSVGGMIVYDDYGWIYCNGITRFISEQIPEQDRIILHNLNGHAVIIKIR